MTHSFPTRRASALHWCAKLWKPAEARSPARRGVLNRQQSSAAPFAAEAKALSEAKDAEQERRDPSDHLISGQEGDGQGRSSHQHERCNKSGFPAYAIAEMAKDARTQRAGDKGEGKAGIGCHKLG